MTKANTPQRESDRTEEEWLESLESTDDSFDLTDSDLLQDAQMQRHESLFGDLAYVGDPINGPHDFDPTFPAEIGPALLLELQNKQDAAESLDGALARSEYTDIVREQRVAGRHQNTAAGSRLRNVLFTRLAKPIGEVMLPRAGAGRNAVAWAMLREVGLEPEFVAWAGISGLIGSVFKNRRGGFEREFAVSTVLNTSLAIGHLIKSELDHRRAHSIDADAYRMAIQRRTKRRKNSKRAKRDSIAHIIKNAPADSEPSTALTRSLAGLGLAIVQEILPFCSDFFVKKTELRGRKRPNVICATEDLLDKTTLLRI